jgi:hypothetical protein
MADVKLWSDEQVNSVFDQLGLLNPVVSGPELLLGLRTSTKPMREILLPRLSDSSVPLPSGSITDANLEKPSR